MAQPARPEQGPLSRLTSLHLGLTLTGGSGRQDPQPRLGAEEGSECYPPASPWAWGGRRGGERRWVWEVGAQESSGRRPWRVGDMAGQWGGCLGRAEQGAYGGECGLSLRGSLCLRCVESQVRITQKHS